MLRLKRYNFSQKLVGNCTPKGTASDDVTNMSEIVKRFFRHEPLPQTDEDQHFQYEDKQIIDPETGEPKTDKYGRIITENVLTSEVLELIPITPNLDDFERADDDFLKEIYTDATEKARSVVRQKRIEEYRNKKKAELKAEAEFEKKAQSLGYSRNDSVESPNDKIESVNK